MRVTITIDVQGAGGMLAAGHQRAIEAIFARICADYPSARLQVRARRPRLAVRNHTNEMPVKVPTGRLHTYED